MAERKIFNSKILDEIGTSLSDFEEVKEGDKDYYILGKGPSGFTEKMKSKRNSKFYAIKKLDKKGNCNYESLERQAQIYIDLDHPNLIKLYGFFEDKEKIDKYKCIYNDKELGTEDKEVYCLVLECAENGSLEDYFKKYQEKNKTKKSFVPIPQNIIIQFLKQLLEALKFLHSLNIAYLDIKPDNILLGENNIIKISDFDLSVQVTDQNFNDDLEEILYSDCTMAGRKDFIFPENKKGADYSFKANIYSTGLIILKLISEKNPFEVIKDGNQQEIIKINEGYIFKTYNKYLIKLIKKMIEADINLRPTSSQCLEELENIKKIIDNPKDKLAKKYLENK